MKEQCAHNGVNSTIDRDGILYLIRKSCETPNRTTCRLLYARCIGKVLHGFDLMTETYGELNYAKDNAVLICHAFSGNHHAAGKKDGEKKPGWWDELLETARRLIQGIILLLL